MKIYKILMLFTLPCFLLGCIQSHSPKDAHETKIVMLKLPKLNPFNSINIAGPFTVKIVDNSKRQSVELVGANYYVHRVKAWSLNHTLYLNVPPTMMQLSPNDILVKVYLKKLNHLVYSSKANINVKKNSRSNISVVSNGAGDLVMAGHVNLTQLINHGSGNITINNVNNQNLIVDDTGPGYVHVTGKSIALNKLDHSGSGNISIKQVNGVLPLDIFTQSSGVTKINGKNINLHHVDYNGSGELDIAKVDSNFLTLALRGSGQVNIFGNANLTKLDAYGSTKLNIQEVDSNGLNVYAPYGSNNLFLTGHIDLLNLIEGANNNIHIGGINSSEMMVTLAGAAKAHLAGHAQIMNARTSKISILDGYYFYVKDIYIKTLDASQANLRPINLLTAYAKDQSDVYYYQQPKFIAPYMSRSGSILPMFHGAPPYPIYWDKAGEYTPKTPHADFEHVFQG